MTLCAVGMEYQAILVQPEVRSAIRDLTGKTSAKKLYNEGLESINVQVRHSSVQAVSLLNLGYVSILYAMRWTS